MCVYYYYGKVVKIIFWMVFILGFCYIYSFYENRYKFYIFFFKVDKFKLKS